MNVGPAKLVQYRPIRGDGPGGPHLHASRDVAGIKDRVDDLTPRVSKILFRRADEDLQLSGRLILHSDCSVVITGTQTRTCSVCRSAARLLSPPPLSSLWLNAA